MCDGGAALAAAHVRTIISSCWYSIALILLLPLSTATTTVVAAPPPVINATCAKLLNSWCNSSTTNGACIKDLTKVFPAWAPLLGLWAPECGSFLGSGRNKTCGKGPPKPAAWRCYSHLALDSRHKWDGVHPIGCTRPELARVYADCMGIKPPPPPPPSPAAGAIFTGPVYDVFFPGLQPKLREAGMESCYRIPSLLYVPPRVAVAGDVDAAPTRVTTPGVLLAVAESKHGHVCGDGVNSTLVMRRSTDLGSSWGKPFFPFMQWQNHRKWGQPQMVYDAMTQAALLLFSNETLDRSPGGKQSLGSVLQIASTSAGATWSAAKRVDSRDADYPTGPAPTSGNGVQLRAGYMHAGRLILSMDTSGYTGDQLLISDNNAQSYVKSYALNRTSMNEIQIAQLGNGSVLAVMRNNVRGAHSKAVAVSSDGGETFGPIHEHPQLVSPTCQSSILYAGGNTILFAGPRSPSSRVRMTVLASDNNGAYNSFNRSLEIWPKTSMYSSMQRLSHGEVALLFERDGGNISLVRFNTSDLKAESPAPALGELKISNVLGSGMVLQRLPANARIWGTAEPGALVTVVVIPSKQSSVKAASVINQTITATVEANGNWSVRFGITPAGNPYSIEISRNQTTQPHAWIDISSVSSIILTDVLAGEVHLCSGQSNMDFSVAGVFNASAECAAASNPMLRLFKATRRTSRLPLSELSAAPLLNDTWSKSTSISVCGPNWQRSLNRGVGFSAACLFYSHELQLQLQVPVGAIHSAWGGTNIEAWMSAEAMAACPNHTAPGKSEVPEPSALYNAMLNPFVPMVVASFLWWQGESNAWTVANAREYSCNQRAMITDLRAKFESSVPLPFIFVQSFPLYGNLSMFQPYASTSSPALMGLSELRLSQADSLSLPSVAMACTIDLGDVGCPFTWQHNRAKRACAHRAALAARALVYNQSIVYRGPEPKHVQILPFQCSHDGCGPGTGNQYTEIAITFDMFGSIGFHHSPVPISLRSFEVLFTDKSVPPASAGKNHSFWIPATILPAEGNIVKINPVDTIGIGVTAFFAQTPEPRAVRYAHGDFPTGILHNFEGLPVAPFVVDISLSQRLKTDDYGAGGIYYGEWKNDTLGLPVFQYTFDQISNSSRNFTPSSATPCRDYHAQHKSKSAHRGLMVHVCRG
jgi:sialate O-acetylesterase